MLGIGIFCILIFFLKRTALSIFCFQIWFFTHFTVFSISLLHCLQILFFVPEIAVLNFLPPFSLLALLSHEKLFLFLLKTFPCVVCSLVSVWYFLCSFTWCQQIEIHKFKLMLVCDKVLVLNVIHGPHISVSKRQDVLINIYARTSYQVCFLDELNT